MYRFALIISVAAAITFSTRAQEMKRRPFLGIMMQAVTDDIRRVMDIAGDQGVLITDVIPNSTAVKAGFKKGDILLSVNGIPFSSIQELSQYIATQKNDAFNYELLRDKKKLKGDASFMRFPQESYPDLKLTYTQVKTNTGMQRVIITRPAKGTSTSTLVFIGGIGCYSMDFPMDTSRSELQMLNYIARAGFTTVRIEKPGMGDNNGYSKPCSEIGFDEELTGYVQAINALKQNKEIQGNNIYLFGHSMGGVMAPMIAARTPVKGIIAYGTIGSNFTEYLAKTRRTVAAAYNMEPDSTDEFVKDYCECAAYYFTEKMTTAQAAEKKPVCREYLSIFDYRSRLYNDELYALNIPALWRPFNGKALVIWGESDYISSKEDHTIITDALNHYRPGSATFASLQATTHGMQYAENFQQARSNPGAYNAELGKLVLNWLKHFKMT